MYKKNYPLLFAICMFACGTITASSEKQNPTKRFSELFDRVVESTPGALTNAAKKIENNPKTALAIAGLGTAITVYYLKNYFRPSNSNIGIMQLPEVNTKLEAGLNVVKGMGTLMGASVDGKKQAEIVAQRNNVDSLMGILNSNNLAALEVYASGHEKSLINSFLDLIFRRYKIEKAINQPLLPRLDNPTLTSALHLCIHSSKTRSHTDNRLLDYLLKNGADTTKTTLDKLSPLYLAVETAKDIIDSTDEKISDEKRKSAVAMIALLAPYCKNQQIAKPENNGSSVLSTAIAIQKDAYRKQIVETLTSTCCMDGQELTGSAGITPLVDSLRQGKHDVARTLLSKPHNSHTMQGLLVGNGTDGYALEYLVREESMETELDMILKKHAGTINETQWGRALTVAMEKSNDTLQKLYTAMPEDLQLKFLERQADQLLSNDELEIPENVSLLADREANGSRLDVLRSQITNVVKKKDNKEFHRNFQIIMIDAVVNTEILMNAYRKNQEPCLQKIFKILKDFDYSSLDGDERKNIMDRPKKETLIKLALLNYPGALALCQKYEILPPITTNTDLLNIALKFDCLDEFYTESHDEGIMTVLNLLNDYATKEQIRMVHFTLEHIVKKTPTNSKINELANILYQKNVKIKVLPASTFIDQEKTATTTTLKERLKTLFNNWAKYPDKVSTETNPKPPVMVHIIESKEEAEEEEKSAEPDGN